MWMDENYRWNNKKREQHNNTKISAENPWMKTIYEINKKQEQHKYTQIYAENPNSYKFTK